MINGIYSKMEGVVGKIKSNLLNRNSLHRRIAFGFLRVGVFVLIAKLVGAAKEVLLAWCYGVSGSIDSYVFVVNIVNWPVSILFGVFSAVVVPLILDVRNNTPAELPRFQRELLGVSILIGIFFWGVSYWAFPAATRYGWFGLSGVALAQAMEIIRPLSVLALVGPTISLFSVWLLALGSHRNTLFEAVPAFVICIFLMISGKYSFDVLIWGTVAGYIFQLIVLALSLLLAGELKLPTIFIKSPVWGVLWRGMAFMVIGQFMISLTGIIDQLVAAKLSAGTLSAINYSNKLLSLVLGIGAIAISRAMLPVFSDTHSMGANCINEVAIKWARWMFFIGLGVLIIGWLLAPFLVKVLFQRGAFTSENGVYVVSTLRYALIQVPFYAFSVALVNVVASQKKYKVLLVSGVIGLIVKIFTVLLLVPYFKAAGLMISAAFVYGANGGYFYLSQKGKK